MKKLLILIMSLFTILTANSQVANRLAIVQALPITPTWRNYVWVDQTPGNMRRMYTASLDSLKWSSYQLPWLKDSARIWNDTSNTNELQEISILGNTVTLNKSGGSINLPIPSVKRIESYSGTTNASGAYTVTFLTPYSVAPNVQASIPNQSATNQFIRVSNVTTTGCTINVFARASINLLGIDLIASATTNVSGASVDILVIEK